MTNKKLDWDKPLQTRDGRKVRIYCRDAGGDFPVHGAVCQKNGDKWLSRSWTADGIYAIGYKDPKDLINVPEERWVNLYDARKFASDDDPVEGEVIGMPSVSREEAIRGVSFPGGYLGTVRIQDGKVVGFEVFEEKGDD